MTIIFVWFAIHSGSVFEFACVDGLNLRVDAIIVMQARQAAPTIVQFTRS